MFLLAGAVWVYSPHSEVQHTSKDSSDYCSRTCYWYTFWMVTISLIIAFFMLVATCGVGLVAIMSARKS